MYPAPFSILKYGDAKRGQALKLHPVESLNSGNQQICSGTRRQVSLLLASLSWSCPCAVAPRAGYVHHREYITQIAPFHLCDSKICPLLPSCRAPALTYSYHCLHSYSVYIANKPVANKSVANIASATCRRQYIFATKLLGRLLV